MEAWWSIGGAGQCLLNAGQVDDFEPPKSSPWSSKVASSLSRFLLATRCKTLRFAFRGLRLLLAVDAGFSLLLVNT